MVSSRAPGSPWGRRKGQPRAMDRAQLSSSGQITFCSPSFAVFPSALFQALELPFNSSRKQLRNLCFFWYRRNAGDDTLGLGREGRDGAGSPLPEERCVMTPERSGVSTGFPRLDLFLCIPGMGPRKAPSLFQCTGTSCTEKLRGLPWDGNAASSPLENRHLWVHPFAATKFFLFLGHCSLCKETPRS